MRGLFLNDLYHIRKRFLFLWVLIFGLGGILVFVDTEFQITKTLFVIIYDCVLISIIPLSLCNIDETEKWATYSITFPVSRKTYVSEKYALGLILSAFSGILLSCVPLINMLRLSIFHIRSYVFGAAVILAVSFLIQTLTFPIFFRFSSARAYSLFIVIGTICGGSFAVMEDDDLLSRIHLESIPIWISVLVIFVSLLLYALSWKLSVRFYQKREL